MEKDMYCWVHIIVFLLAVVEKGVSTRCSSSSDCSLRDLQAGTTAECCAQPRALSYVPVSDAETCSPCYAYGWVEDIAENYMSAELQHNVTAVEGENVTLNIFFTKNGHLNSIRYRFIIHTSGTAESEVDYVLIHNEFLGLNLDGTRGPATVTVSLLNDQECEEEAETLTLTLAYDISFHGQNPLNPAEVLVHDTVTVTILDNTFSTGFPKREIAITEGTVRNVCLKTHGVPALNTTVDVTPIPGTAGLTDLRLTTTKVTITAADTEPCIMFSAIAGDGPEKLEKLSLMLSGPSHVLLVHDSLTVFIFDENSDTVEGSTGDKVEDEGDVEVDQNKTDNEGGNSLYLEVIIPVVLIVVTIILLLITILLAIAYILYQRKINKSQDINN